MNILFIDTETTGVDANKHTIIELSARLDVDGKTVDRFHSKFFNPAGISVDLGALKVNKTSVSTLITLGQEDKEFVRFADWLLTIPSKVKGNVVVCGQNVQFDINFIKALLNKYSMTGLESIIGYKYIDTFSLAITLIQAGIIRSEKTNLESLAQALDIDTSKYDLHTAVGDTDLVAEVYYKITKRLTDLQQHSRMLSLNS